MIDAKAEFGGCAKRTNGWPSASKCLAPRSNPTAATSPRATSDGQGVPSEDIVKGYELEKGQYIEVSKEELEEIALESTRTIEIDEFVDRADIDLRYLIPIICVRMVRSAMTPSP